jgi:hypothetical protein
MKRVLSPLTALLALLLLACGDGGGGSGGSGVKSMAPTPFPTSSDPSQRVPAGAVKPVNAVIAGSDSIVGDNNFALGITDAKDEPVGGAKVKATFYDLRDARNPKPVFTTDAIESAPGVGKIVEVRHANGEVHKHGGEDDNRVAYYARVKFTYAGSWGVAIQATLKDGTVGTSNVAFFVREKSSIPVPGQKAIASDNLTKKDVKNVSEIDSGTPPNDMHDVKIKDAIAAGRPLVIVFSTPAYCTSRFCGPVNEEVEALQAIYKDRVDFVHIEIWRDFDKHVLNPTAKEWLSQPNGDVTEPWVYIVDKTGVIYDRFEGPSAKSVLEPDVKAVAEGKTYR